MSLYSPVPLWPSKAHLPPPGGVHGAGSSKTLLEKKDESKLLKEVGTICHDMFGKSVANLKQADRIELALRLWNEGKTHSIKQLARLTRNNEDVLRSILHVPKKQ